MAASFALWSVGVSGADRLVCRFSSLAAAEAGMCAANAIDPDHDYRVAPVVSTMTAQELFGMLKFVGGRPMLILRDHTAGRIKVFLKGAWVATVIPGELIGYDCDAVLLGCSDQGYDFEERTTWGGVACALSEFQQTGNVPCMDSDGFIYE